MTKILTFDSIYLLQPFRYLYTALIRKILNSKETTNTRLVLCRLDKDNIFLRDKRNISGITTGTHKDHVDAMSINFYRYLCESDNSDALSINDIPLYQLYPRQIKLKLGYLLICALRVRVLSINSEESIEIVTDRQTASIMKAAFLFLNYTPKNITWKLSGLLTFYVTINSLIMRSAAIVKMHLSPSTLPSEYFYKFLDPNIPTVLYVLPKVRPEDLITTYVEQLDTRFNIILYSMGSLNLTPNNYERVEFKKTTSFLRGVFKTKNLFWTSDSYITDITLIYKNHADLIRSVDVVNAIFSNRIDAHISKQQTNALETYLSIEAQKRSIFILADIMEEVFYCDSAVCSSASQKTESLELALANGGDLTFKGGSSLINYRMKDITNKKGDYLHDLLGVDSQKKIIFYASDPSREESQRFLTETFLIDYFSKLDEFCLVIKTHPEDQGRVTNYAYLDSINTSNVFLIGDLTRRSKMISKQFRVFDDFDFHAAIASSDGFLTFSSSAILEALALGVKTGIVDIFSNGFYDYLINYKVTALINDETSLKAFTEKQKLDVSDDVLTYCGLKNSNEEFDLGAHLLECLEKYDWGSDKNKNNNTSGQQ